VAAWSTRWGFALLGRGGLDRAHGPQDALQGGSHGPDRFLGAGGRSGDARYDHAGDHLGAAEYGHGDDQQQRVQQGHHGDGGQQHQGVGDGRHQRLGGDLAQQGGVGGDPGHEVAGLAAVDGRDA
jgi:hypothetical protein